MTNTQLIVVSLCTLFPIAILVAFYLLDSIRDRLEQILGRPLDGIVQRLDAIDSSLREANLHRKTISTRIDSLAERR